MLIMSAYICVILIIFLRLILIFIFYLVGEKSNNNSKNKCDLNLMNYLRTKFKNVYQYESINNYK